MGNSFLFAAYALVWIIFMVYAWNISRRQAQLRKDLEELKRSRQSSAKSSDSPLGGTRVNIS